MIKHIIPKWGSFTHEQSQICPCEPETRFIDDEVVVIHNLTKVESVINDEYKAAKDAIFEYEDAHFRKRYMCFREIFELAFQQIVPCKHWADLEPGDIVFLPNKATYDNHSDTPCIYEMVLCKAAIGRTDFAGVNVDKQERVWRNTDKYKIVSFRYTDWPPTILYQDTKQLKHEHKI